MLNVYKRGGTVYLHCKAGLSRSSLMGAIFMSILHLSTSNPRIEYNEKALKQLLKSKITKLKEQRPQINIDKDKIKLGIRVLQQYTQAWKDSAPVEQEEIYTQSASFFAKLTQSPEFKALWYFAYNNEQYLADVQKIMQAIYEEPTKLLTLVVNNSRLGQAYQNIINNELGALALTQLKQFILNHEYANFEARKQSALNQAFDEFNRMLANYHNTSIIDIALQLKSDILLSSAPDKDKILWLSRTAQFLDDPMFGASSYLMEADNAVLSDDPAISRLGKTVIIFGGVTLAAILLLGVISPSFFSLPVIIAVGLAALACVLLGKCIMYSASENKVRDHSQELAHELKLIDRVGP
jgi:hypothetical protein